MGGEEGGDRGRRERGRGRMGTPGELRLYGN